MSGEEVQPSLANTLFPPPPPFYKAYTTENLARRSELEDRNSGEPLAGAEGEELVSLQRDLSKPRADWVGDDGRWICFGEVLSIAPRIPTAAEIGLPRFSEPDTSAQETMPVLLHSYLHTMMLLLDVLTNTARALDALHDKGWGHEGDQYIQHLTDLAATMMVTANQLRSDQAEATLLLLMEKQLAERRAQTAALRSKCEQIAVNLRALRQP